MSSSKRHGGAIEIGDGMEEPFDFSNLERRKHLIAKM